MLTALTLSGLAKDDSRPGPTGTRDSKDLMNLSYNQALSKLFKAPVLVILLSLLV